MDVEIVCYGEVRQVVGRKRLVRTFPPSATVEDLLVKLSAEFSDFEPNDIGRADLVISKNGRNVRHIDGMDTLLEDGCVVSLSGSVVAE